MGKKILVATDGSRPAKHAVRYAADLSKKIGATVLVLRVINIPRFSHWATTYKVLEKELEEEAQKILDDARSIAREYGVEVETMVRKGYPDEEILKVVKEDLDIILLAVGASGKDLTSRRMLGSVTEEVVREVSRSLPCPVVVIPGADEMIHERLGI